MADKTDIIVGIDLGTTNSLIAFCDGSGPRICRGADGEALVPSVLGFGPNGHLSVGRHAKDHAMENPLSTVYSVKRLMGRGYDELRKMGELAHLPYHVVQRASDTPTRDMAAVEIDGRILTPPEISAVILRELKQLAEAELGRDVNRAVITVPAYFDDAQRQATRDAGRIAGLDVARIINEPTAAALAYGIGARGSGRQAAPSLTMAGTCPSTGEECSRIEGGDSIVAVYDLGGGTFDVSVLRLVQGVFEVLSTHGDTQLGGDDLDREIIGLVEREVQDQYGIDIRSPSTRQALRSFAESVKIRLSTDDAADIEIDLGDDRFYRRRIMRDEFEAMIDPWVARTIHSCRQALRDAKLKPGDIERVVMVGGSTRIPLVRQRVEETFGTAPYTALNPDEVVALGAAVQASILAGTRSDALLLDVIPLSLGIETMGGAMGKLIMRNTRIPCQASEQFSTFVDGQTNVKINVLQGERELAVDCQSLGQFDLRGIPPMPAGLPKIMVTFLVDENGILNVSAREQRSGQQASIQVIPAHGLTREEVGRIERESYEHAREDMTAHRLIDLRNQVTFDTHKAEQMLAKVGDAIGEEDRSEVLDAMESLRALAVNCRDAEELHQALNAFDRRTVRLAEVAIARTLRESD